MKALIAYYSLTGTTKKLAGRMAVEISGDVIRIPLFGAGTLSPEQLSEYDIVIVGTPIWLYAPAFPVSRFLSRNKSRLPKVAFFCTYQTAIGASFAKMEGKCGKKPAGELQMTGPEIGTEAGALKIRQYIEQITR